MTCWHQEWLLACRSWSNLIHPLAFFLLISCLFPMAVDVTPSVLMSLAPGVIWLSILLAMVLDMPNSFLEDHQDGTLEQWLIASDSLIFRIVIRLTMRWLFMVGPIILLCPLIGALYGLSWDMVAKLIAGIVVGSPTIVLLGGLVSALLLTIRQAGLLLALLVLPLLVPVLLFAVGLTQTVSFYGVFALLGGISVLCLTLVPWAVGFVLRELIV